MQQKAQQPCNSRPSLRELAERVLTKGDSNSARNNPTIEPVASGGAGCDYTLAELQEMDRLLRELAELEGWSADELAGLLDERQRMAPVNVRGMLIAVRAAHRAALAPWPDAPKKRSCIRLCRLTVIDGGKVAA